MADSSETTVNVNMDTRRFRAGVYELLASIYALKAASIRAELDAERRDDTPSIWSRIKTWLDERLYRERGE